VAWRLVAILGPCNQAVGAELKGFGEALVAAFKAECYPEVEAGKGILLVDDPAPYRVCGLEEILRDED
jgi:hypothetical protein